MGWVVGTDAALARILGVSRPAVAKAEVEGKIQRRIDDGYWDVWGVIEAWRYQTMATLQRPRRWGAFRPWLDPRTPLTRVIRLEVERRARAEGAWQEDYPDDEDDDWEEEDDAGAAADEEDDR